MEIDLDEKKYSIREVTQMLWQKSKFSKFSGIDRVTLDKLIKSGQIKALRPASGGAALVVSELVVKPKD